MIKTSPILAIVALYAAGLGAAGQFAKFSVPFDALQAAYPDAGTSLGFVVSLISFLGVVFGLFAGIVVARLGFRRFLLSALILGAAVSGFQALMPSLPVMLLSRFLEGTSHLVIVVAAPTLMAQLSSDHYRATTMTIWSTFFGTSFALVAWFGLPLVASFGLPALLLIHSGWMACVAAALWVMLPGGHTTAAQRLTLRDILTRHISAYRSPHVAAPGFGWLCYTLTYVALLTVLPSQMPEADRAWVGGLLPLAGLVVSLTIGMALLRYISGVAMTVAGFSLATCLTLVLLLVPDSAVLAIALLATLGLVQGGSFAAVPQLNTGPDDQALANGVMAQMGNLGNTLGTPLLLVLLSFGGVPAIWLGLAGCYVLGAGLHVLQAARRRT